MLNTLRIGIGGSVSELTGFGLEYLVVGDVVTAKFYNGMLLHSMTRVNNEITLGDVYVDAS